ncbi:MAG: protoporphyrinogen oxidase, partial [Microbacterium sp.]
PPLTIGHQRNLGELVRSRMGDGVCDRLVAPVTRGLFGLEPHDVDADAALPGISTAVTRTGSLAGAVASLAEGRPARSTLAGGLHALPAALAVRLEELAVDVRTGTRATRIIRQHDAWTVAVRSEPTASEEVAGSVAPPSELTADAVILAVPEAVARDLLAAVATLPAPAPRPEVRVTTLRVRMPASDRADVFPLQGDVWRVTDATAGNAAPAAVTSAEAAGERIVRVTGPAPDHTAVELTAGALAAVSSAFGVDLTDRDLVAAAHVRVPWSPAVRIDRAAEAEAVRDALGDAAGLAVTGAWLSGDGVERVVADAIAESTRLRRRALWGGEPDQLRA